MGKKFHKHWNISGWGHTTTAVRHASYCHLLSRKQRETIRHLTDVRSGEPKIADRYSLESMAGQCESSSWNWEGCWPIQHEAGHEPIAGLKAWGRLVPRNSWNWTPGHPSRIGVTAGSGIKTEQDRSNNTEESDGPIKDERQKQSPEISECNQPCFWTRYQKRQGSSVKLEKQLWNKPPPKSSEKLISHKNEQHKSIKVKLHAESLEGKRE